MRKTKLNTVRSAPEQPPVLIQVENPPLYRRWFIRQLIPEVGGLRYAWLTFGNNSVEQISESPYIDIAIDETELADWKSCCLNSPYVIGSSIEAGSNSTTIFLELKGSSLLEVTLIHCSKKKKGFFSNPRVMLDNVHINEEGMKIAPLAFVMEYLFSAPLNSAQDQSGFKAYYQFLPLEQKQKILCQLSHKYRSCMIKDHANMPAQSSPWRWIKHTGHQMWSSLGL